MTDYQKLKLIILAQHIIAVIGVIWMFSWIGLGVAFFMFLVYYAFGMILGFHRVFAHKSYVVGNKLKRAMLIAGSLSGMGSSVGWVGQHRWHHAYADQPDKDPYYSEPGIWSKTKAWALYPANTEFKITVIKDLIRDKDHMFMHKHYYSILFAWVLILAMISPWAVIYLWALPAVLCYTDLTLVGVFGHVAGQQPHHTTDQSRDNHILSIFTLGESYQNLHHHNAAQPIQGKFDIIGIISNKFLKNV
jgi:stearoyl-CoA desaturase (delta-9 desaturase)